MGSSSSDWPRLEFNSLLQSVGFVVLRTSKSGYNTNWGPFDFYPNDTDVWGDICAGPIRLLLNPAPIVDAGYVLTWKASSTYNYDLYMYEGTTDCTVTPYQGNNCGSVVTHQDVTVRNTSTGYCSSFSSFDHRKYYSQCYVDSLGLNYTCTYMVSHEMHDTNLKGYVGNDT